MSGDQDGPQPEDVPLRKMKSILWDRGVRVLGSRPMAWDLTLSLGFVIVSITVPLALSP